jgi:ComF family protein
LICTECYDRTGKQEFSFALAISALTLDEISGRLIVLYKDNNEHRLASILAELIISALPLSWLTWADTLTWIPADRKALRRRGFDHMQRIALEVANLTQLSATSLLNKQVCRDQRGLNRAQRKENLKKSFSLKAQAGSLPAHILLLDDVFTTGSTLDAAAALLSESGAAEVRAVSIARAW